LARLFARRSITGVGARLGEELVTRCCSHRAATVQHLLKARVRLANVVQAGREG
jgi:hypothetical protein